MKLSLQLISGNFLKSYGKDIINIHHGLLPSFKGGHPSKQVQQSCLLPGLYKLSPFQSFLCFLPNCLFMFNLLDCVGRLLMQV